jgi:hypothetical protein
MSDEAGQRQTMATLKGQSAEVDGNASLLAHKLDSQLEIVVSEENGTDAAMLLSKDQAHELAHALLTAVENPPLA